ncbi:MAG: sodium:solute symporter family protein, partial [Nannocystaceae bacterium]
MSDLSTILAIVCMYFFVVLGIGLAAGRQNARTAEDYFLAGRSVKTLVLFMALVGTNITPFVLMGIPGLAYHRGIGVFGQNASIIVLGIPLSIYLIGLPSWRRARALGAVTPAELYARHFDARWFGWLVFTIYFVFTVPYMVTAVSGVGIAVDTFSNGEVSFEHAAAGILLVTLLYTSFGGMRGTMWTNVLQGSIFLAFSVVAFFLIAEVRGGVGPTMREVASAHPDLMDVPNEGPFRVGPWASWGLGISLCVVAFPHMLVRIFAAHDEASLKNACRLYPAAMVLLWVPCVLFGIWGTLDFPALVGRASDAVFPMLVQRHLGPLAQGLALASILAAVMSTLDAQMLTLSSMLTRDVLGS